MITPRAASELSEPFESAPGDQHTYRWLKGHAVFERIMINLGWTGWIVLSVKVWAQVACWVEPQMWFQIQV